MIELVIALVYMCEQERLCGLGVKDDSIPWHMRILDPWQTTAENGKTKLIVLGQIVQALFQHNFTPWASILKCNWLRVQPRQINTTRVFPG